MCSSRCVCLLAAWVQCLVLTRAGADLDSGLVGYWPLDNHATNLAGIDHNGGQSVPQTQFLKGQFSQGFEFQKDGPPLRLGSAIDFNKDLTFSVWFRYEGVLTLLQNPGESLTVHVWPTEQGLMTDGELLFKSPDHPAVNLPVRLDGQFHLLTITSDPSGLKLFIDSDLAYARKERPTALLDAPQLGSG